MFREVVPAVFGTKVPVYIELTFIDAFNYLVEAHVYCLASSFLKFHLRCPQHIGCLLGVGVVVVYG